MDWKCPIIPVTRLRAASKLPKRLVLFVLTAHSLLHLRELYTLTCHPANSNHKYPDAANLHLIVKAILWSKVVQALIEADLAGLESGSWPDGIFCCCLPPSPLPDWLWARGMGWRFPDGILPISSYLHNFDNPAFLYILSEGTYRKDFWKLSRVSSPKVSFLGIFHALPKKWNYGIWNKWECRQFIFSKELL